MTVTPKALKLAQQVQQKVNALRCADPVYVVAVVKAIANQLGVTSTEDVFSYEQVLDQSLAMHRMALSFNKHTNAEKANAAYTDPQKVSAMREQILELTEENIRLHQELAKARASESEDLSDLLTKTEQKYKDENDFLRQQLEMLQKGALTKNTKRRKQSNLIDCNTVNPTYLLPGN